MLARAVNGLRSFIEWPAGANGNIECHRDGHEGSALLPAQAIMAPLSVHNSSGGMHRETPRSFEPCLSNVVRKRRFRATPPAATNGISPLSPQHPYGRCHRPVAAGLQRCHKPLLRNSHKDRRWFWSVSGASFSAWRLTAVFNPAMEKCGSSRPLSGRGKRKRPLSPVCQRCLCTAGPPGKPMSRSFAVLSNASPSASSIVVPIRR